MLVCPKCHRSDEMVKHEDGRWVCHHTHILERDKHGYVPPKYPKDGPCDFCGKRRDDKCHG